LKPDKKTGEMMKTKLISFLNLVVILLLTSCQSGKIVPVIENNSVEVYLVNSEKCLWIYSVKKDGAKMEIAPPEFEIDGKTTHCSPSENLHASDPVNLNNNVTEYTFSGVIKEDSALTLQIVFRIAPDNPVIRYKYILKSTGNHKLTKSKGIDNLSYFGTSLDNFTGVKEIQFSNFDEKLHSYVLGEQVIQERHFDNEFGFMGPMLIAGKGNTTFLLAYEHGSQYNNPFLQFKLRKDRTVNLVAVKGNYLDKQDISAGSDYETIWFEIAGKSGSEDDLAADYRTFILKYISLNPESRQPYIYYNTWARQERVKWQGGTYLQTMNLKQTSDEIDRASEMGVDVFVIDAGWFLKTGDWIINTSEHFFPDSLSQVVADLKKHNMKLGLWFNPTLAALSSKILENNRDCRAQRNGILPPAFPVWETENSVNMCLVSDYWNDFSEELIRLYNELGVTYFKWDAIEQGDCDAPGHYHGTEENTIQERREYNAFLQPIYMSKIIDKVSIACPNAIFDFDITEGGRCVGLSFLSSGRYHAINNGPYFHNYDLAPEWKTPLTNGNVNIFVNPGPARGWFTRSILTYDKWLPSILFLTHYQPDEPKNSQIINIASLILGQNGIWGEILKTSPGDAKMFGEILGKYKQVKNDITNSSPVTSGKPGEIVEIHEKINSGNGKGTVVIFNIGNKPVTYITRNKVDRRYWSNENVKIIFDDKGRAVIDATFKETGAKIVFFGVEK
jgi:alpha-galactosidase